MVLDSVMNITDLVSIDKMSVWVGNHLLNMSMGESSSMSIDLVVVLPPESMVKSTMIS